MSSIVDRCGSDLEPGGTNLAIALATGRPITFNCGGPVTIRITQLHRVSGRVLIDGGNNVTLDGGGTSSFLSAAQASAGITLRNITIRAMKPTGRASVVDGGDEVTIVNSRILDSLMPMSAANSITIEGSTFENNQGVVVQAKTAVIGNSVFRRNRAIAVSVDGGTASITDSTFEENGESIFTRCGQVSIVRSTYSRNSSLINALRPGGALRTDCPLEVVNTTFIGNSTTAGGGAVHLFATARSAAIIGSRFTENRTERGGGALSVDWTNESAPQVTIKHTIFKLNTAKDGGAMFIGGVGSAVPGPQSRLTASAVTFIGNVASERGGAIAAENAEIKVNRGFFLRNAAASGGAVWTDPPAASANLFSNALFALNKAQDGAFVGRSVTFANATILGSEGAGIVFLPPPANAVPADRSIRLANSIVENNSGGNCTGDGTTLVAEGTNLQFPDTSCGNSITVSPALLDAFYAPIIGGAARANGADAICLGPLVGGIDAYGARRPQADHCSIGAVEGDMKRIVSSLEKPSPTPPDPGKGHDGTAVDMTSGTGSEDGSGDDRVDRAACPGSADRVAPLTPGKPPSALLAKLLDAGIDFSVPMHDLENWLANPEFTPYPALSEALLALFENKRLKCPAFLDVIVWNYEHSEGVMSPRRASQVDIKVLRASVVQGFNTRYSASEKDFDALLK